jgi:hypothetical protein
VAFNRYEIHYGINPVSAECYKIWDIVCQQYIRHPKYKSEWEFVSKENAEIEVARRVSSEDH